ncbi:hypothetical protein [Nitrosospira sp. Nsp2]|uniref:hypothetical protein n=1 Tax=Nitrosospira sp. Nsp2 TaxID=136548 RepID=UPI0011B26516|nr:hypothetical protein [Nitrosospira sp. Nsp2]
MRAETLVPLLKKLAANQLLSATDVVITNTISAVIANQNPDDLSLLPPLFQAWLGRELAIAGRFSEAKRVATLLQASNGDTRRHAIKILMRVATDETEFEVALALAANAIIDNEKLAVVLPLEYLLKTRKWKDFAEIDPIKVGWLSHYAFLFTGDHKIGFICRMACRKFYGNGQKAKLVDIWNELTEARKREITAFLRDVWIDDNLTMLDLDSTQAVRNERLLTLQLLLQLDEGSEQAYADEIKNLTFQETLWKGLQHINELRIFVNESAILRWAEKELAQDFERLERSELSQGAPIVADSLLRGYLLEPGAEDFLKALSREPLSEANALLVGLVERLMQRFLTDPTAGLNCYLSSRIRHGSLKGTILSPLEQGGLIGHSGTQVISNYLPALELPALRSEIELAINRFNQRVNATLDELITHRIQIRNAEHPQGAIYVSTDIKFVAPLLAELAKAATFQQFVTTCFQFYWFGLRESLLHLSRDIREEVKNSLQMEVDLLIMAVNACGEAGVSLVSTLRTLATATKSQCDIAADWFLLEKNYDQQTYNLHEAIEIAVTATRNVYRRFSAFVNFTNELEIVLPLTAYGLSVIVDCLYIVLENAWKHSGLGATNYEVKISASFDEKNNVLLLNISSPLSIDVREQLRDHRKLETLRDRFLQKKFPIELLTTEGGSGMAKLASMTRLVDTSAYPTPFDFGIESENQWGVKICIQLYPRGGAYDAYE